MSDGVKRVYSSELRVSQARETRRAVVAAAGNLFASEGFGRTTIDDIARVAGVSRKTVFAAVGGKVALLKLALDWSISGDDEPVALAERPQVLEISRATDPEVILEGWVRIVADIASRQTGLSEALTVAAGIDPEARELWSSAEAQRLSGARAFLQHLADHQGLRPGLTVQEAADIAWFYSNPGVYHQLVNQRGWTHEQFLDWLRQTMRQQLQG